MKYEYIFSAKQTRISQFVSQDLVMVLACLKY